MTTADRPAVRRCGVASDDDRDWLLDGAGVGVDAGELDEAAVVLGMLVVPEVLEGVEELVAHGAALGEVGADRPELGFEVADTDAEREAATTEHVDARHLLRQHDRVSLREDHDAGGETDRGRRCRSKRQRDQRVECRILRPHRRRRDLRVRQHDVLASPQRLEAGSLRGLRRRHQLVGLDTQRPC